MLRPGAFICIGSLTCFGMTHLVDRFSAVAWNWHFYAQTPQDRIVAAFVNQLFTTAAVALVLSTIPIAWLYKILGGRHVDV